jgi:hypothetical protein
MKKTNCQQRKVAQWSNCVAGDFGAPAGLTNLCPGSAIILYVWPHKTLCDQLRHCFVAWVRQIVDGLEHIYDVSIVELERTVEISRQTCRNTWRSWCRDLVASRAAGRCSTAEVFGARRRCSAMWPVLRRMVAQWRTRREIDRRRQRPVQRCMSVMNCAVKSRGLNCHGEHLSVFCWKA